MPPCLPLLIFGAHFTQEIACTLHFISRGVKVAQKPAVHSCLHGPKWTGQPKDAAAQQKHIPQAFHAVLWWVKCWMDRQTDRHPASQMHIKSRSDLPQQLIFQTQLVCSDTTDQLMLRVSYCPSTLLRTVSSVCPRPLLTLWVLETWGSKGPSCINTQGSCITSSLIISGSPLNSGQWQLGMVCFLLFQTLAFFPKLTSKNARQKSGRNLPQIIQGGFLAAAWEAEKLPGWFPRTGSRSPSLQGRLELLLLLLFVYKSPHAKQWCPKQAVCY